MSENSILRGGPFLNRVRIDGILTSKSPLHIGAGYLEPRDGLTKTENDEEANVKVTAVEHDFYGLPYIPGSTLRGNIRHWLLQIFKTFTTEDTVSSDSLAWQHDYDELSRDEVYQNQLNQISFMKSNASILERLFGTSFSNSKIDVWDAKCVTDPTTLSWATASLEPNKPPFWISQKLTYVGQSVVIDPDTGTAIDQKLYHFEIVPEGVQFKLTICGQNLTNLEIGIILFALNGFNSKIFPLTVGAMSNRGFGRMNFQTTKMYMLSNDEKIMKKWFEEIIDKKTAGFESLPECDEQCQQNFIDEFIKFINN